jgi:hypothetical protein
MDHLVGDRLDGKYLIDTRLGEGGMGAVYRATHLGTTRVVAVKIIRPELSSDAAFVERFRREAESLGRLRHPNIVDITDFGFARGGTGEVAYLVMEYLDGCTLADVLEEERRLSTTWVVDILEQVSSAVDEAHRHGIVHRDLKPENIWLEPNRRGGYTVKVLDFGLATPVGGALMASSDAGLKSCATADGAVANGAETRLVPAQLTQAGATMGTPLYMSPEQCRGEPLDARSDIYSLGIVAYRMLAGRTPFVGNAIDVVKQQISGEPPPLGDAPRRVAAVVMSALAKDPGMRPSSAAGFGAALRAGSESTGVMLRRAVALYSEHFPVFIGISLVAYAPLIALIAWLNLDDRRILPPRFAPAHSMSLGIVVFLAMIAANLLGYFTTSAAVVPIVVQIAAAPLREVRIGMALTAIVRRWHAWAGATAAVIAMVIAGTVLLVVPGVVAAVLHALYAPVAIMEGTRVGVTLERARALARRVLSATVVISAIQFAVPILVWTASVKSTFVFRLAEDYTPKELGFTFVTSANWSLFQLLSVFIAPLTGIMLAQLYLKTRYAGGEALTAAAEQDLPRTRWQARMRARTDA